MLFAKKCVGIGKHASEEVLFVLTAADSPQFLTCWYPIWFLVDKHSSLEVDNSD